MKKMIGVIPSRYASTRFPGKSIVDIQGVPMIIRVYKGAKSAKLLSDVIIATDDDRIAEVCRKYNAKYIMTAKHDSGSDRVCEIMEKTDGDFYVNIQGDEPLINGELIDKLLEPFLTNDNIEVITMKKRIQDEDEIFSPNVVKVVCDKNDFALYFSRSTIPFNRDDILDVKYYKHIGVYAYSRNALKKFKEYPKSTYEDIEKLEQLRFLENNIKILVLETDYESIGVDVKEDVEKVISILNKNQK